MSARALCLLVLVACGPRDIDVLRLPALPDGGIPMFDKQCAANSDCMGMGYCEKATCGATTGFCRRRPPGCEDTLSPVCGCDGVNYWNDCLRKEQLVESSTAGACERPFVCTGTALCSAPGSLCASLLSDSAASCSTVPAGECWVIPQICPASDSSAWESCSGAPVCGGLCAAIRSGARHRKVNSCP